MDFAFLFFHCTLPFAVLDVLTKFVFHTLFFEEAHSPSVPLFFFKSGNGMTMPHAVLKWTAHDPVTLTMAPSKM